VAGTYNSQKFRFELPDYKTDVNELCHIFASFRNNVGINCT